MRAFGEQGTGSAVNRDVHSPPRAHRLPDLPRSRLWRATHRRRGVRITPRGGTPSGRVVRDAASPAASRTDAVKAAHRLPAMANKLGLRNVAFEVDDLQATVERAPSRSPWGPSYRKPASPAHADVVACRACASFCGLPPGFAPDDGGAVGEED
jgi:hypothetical protein